MLERCPELSVIGIAVLAGYRWVINARGYANVLASPSHNVYGVLYTITDTDERILDRCEGVPIAYQKKKLEVTDLDGNGTTALVYVDPSERMGKPRPDYVTKIYAGLKDAHLPVEWVQENIIPWVGLAALSV